MSPAYLPLPAAPDPEDERGSPYALNNRLQRVTPIGLGRVDGAEDVILDRDDHLYCGDRRGAIIRFRAPDHAEPELFAHVGGHPLGLAFDRDGRLHACVGGKGLYRVDRQGTVETVAAETDGALASAADGPRLRLANDLDIAPDGRIFFTEATIRFGIDRWPADALESRRNGRIVCADPRRGTTRTVLRKLIFPTGICLARDGQSILFAESWACRISRYWLAGPGQGRVERVIENLPGYPGNINRASDGHYWLALLGLRSPALDLAMRMPGFRRRMALAVAPDEWLHPNVNTGCVVKLSERGEIIETLWDLVGENHPMITSMREHRGHLYLGGVSNNRIGRYKIPGADPHWTAAGSYWGAA